MRNVQDYCKTRLVAGLEKYRNVEGAGSVDAKEVYEDQSINVTHPSRFVVILFLVYHYDCLERTREFTTNTVWQFYSAIRRHSLWNTKGRPKSKTSINHALNKFMGVGLVQRRQAGNKYYFSITDVVSKYGLRWFFSSENRFEVGGVVKGIPSYRSDYIQWIKKELRKYEMI